MKIKHQLTICLLLLLFTACKGQNKDIDATKPTKEKTMNNNNKDIIIAPPYDHFHEGEMNFRHSDEDERVKKEWEERYKEFKNMGYSFPDEETFKEKILEYFKMNIDRYNVNIIALNWDLLPYLINKEKRMIHNEGLYYDTINLTINKYIFYEDKAADMYLRHNEKGKSFIHDMVFEFGYAGRKDWIKMAVGDDLWKKSGGELILFRLLFGEYNIKGGDLELRKDMLDTLVTMGDELDLSLLSSVAEEVLYRTDYYTFKDNSPEGRKEIAGYIYAREVDMGQYGYVEDLIDQDESWIDFFKQNDYFDSENLKTFIEDIYIEKPDRFGRSSMDPQVLTAVITDQDGFTNLRAGKGTEYDIVQEIKTGERVKILDTREEIHDVNIQWLKVETKQGTEGYVHKSRIKIE